MSTQSASKGRALTVRHLLEMKKRGEPIAMLTAYDYLFARLVGLGVDGAITNRQDIGRAVLAELGRGLPRAYPAGETSPDS